jgi:hypothetical protein
VQSESVSTPGGLPATSRHSGPAPVLPGPIRPPRAELDVWIPATGRWRFKDEQQLAERVLDERYTEAQAAATRALGGELGAMLDRGERWWDERWTTFEPDPVWRAPAFPPGWADAPVPPAPPPSAYRALGV